MFLISFLVQWFCLRINCFKLFKGTVKEDLIDLAIYFDDVNRATTIKKQLEEHLKNSKSTEFILLVSYFDELLNKFNLDYNI